MSTKPAVGTSVEIQLAHSPDADDAFMFYALATRKVQAPGLKFIHTLSDIETLNQQAQLEHYDISAISFSAYPRIMDKYLLMDCGASFGDGYGPLVVSSRSMLPKDLPGCRVAVPGPLTTSYLVLKLFAPAIETVTMPFDKIVGAVKENAVDAGLIIHEAQLTFGQFGLHRVIDLGLWWQQQTQMPLPLGGNVIRRSLPHEVVLKAARAIRASIAYALDHREEALNYALQFARDMDPELADRFVGMYVNQWTRSYGEVGRTAVRELLRRGAVAGLIPGPVEPEFFLEEVAA
ncbi:MAG TPA: MqnA/MqnD/SBP family protein [Candidatus Dormibacteraeota bacterium]|nr:MqnA/MqnD/SBP family protein [Candidatus Dormibacteraeota bacterium]